MTRTVKICLALLLLTIQACKKEPSAVPSTVVKTTYDTAYSTCSCFSGDTIRGCAWDPGWTNGYDASAFPLLNAWINVNNTGWKQLPCTNVFYMHDSMFTVVNVANLSIGYKFGVEPKALPSGLISFKVFYKKG